MIEALWIWAVIVGLTVVTVITRSFFLAFGDRVPLPERVQHALRYAPACALMALVAPEVLVPGEPLTQALFGSKLIAALAALATVLLTRSMVAMMAVGMAAFTLLRLL